MKKILLIIFLAAAHLTIAGGHSDYRNAIDEFLTDHPVDLVLAMNAYPYQLGLSNGVNFTLGGGLGWRYQFIVEDEWALSSRISLEYGALSSQEYKGSTFQAPLTLNFAYGRGSSNQSSSDFGFMVGAGGAFSYHKFNRTIMSIPYEESVSLLAPYVYAAMNVGHGKFTYGLSPNYTFINGEHIIGFNVIGYILLD